MALESLQGNQASSRIEGGISWFFSCCGGNLCFPLELQQGSQVTSNVASGKSSLHSNSKGEGGNALE